MLPSSGTDVVLRDVISGSPFASQHLVSVSNVFFNIFLLLLYSSCRCSLALPSTRTFFERLKSLGVSQNKFAHDDDTPLILLSINRQLNLHYTKANTYQAHLGFLMTRSY